MEDVYLDLFILLILSPKARYTVSNTPCIEEPQSGLTITGLGGATVDGFM